MPVTKKICFLYSDKDKLRVNKLIAPIRESIAAGIFGEVETTNGADIVLPFFSPNFIKEPALMKAANRAVITGKKKIMIPIHLSQCDWREWGLVAGRPKFPKEGSLDRVDLNLAAEDLHIILLQFQVAQYRDWGLNIDIPTYIQEDEVNLNFIYTGETGYYFPFTEESDGYSCIVAGKVSGLLTADKDYFLKGSLKAANSEELAEAVPDLVLICKDLLDEAEDRVTEGEIAKLDSLLLDARRQKVLDLKNAFITLAELLLEINSKKTPVFDRRGTHP